MCAQFGVSAGGFYAWVARATSARCHSDEALTRRIVKIHADSLHSYGSPRVRDALLSQGERIGRRRVARLMRCARIEGKCAGQRSRAKAAMRRHVLSVPNCECEVKLSRLDQVWVGDVTYLRVRGQWRYLAVVMDKFSRRILGWSLDRTRDVTLTRSALFHALRKRDPAPGLVFHSDRGVEYLATDYRRLTGGRGIIQSANRPGRINDNAHMESFFHSLKSEFIHGKTFDCDADLRRTLTTYFRFYNYDRIHTSLGRQSPVRFERNQPNQRSVN